MNWVYCVYYGDVQTCSKTLMLKLDHCLHKELTWVSFHLYYLCTFDYIHSAFEKSKKQNKWQNCVTEIEIHSRNSQQKQLWWYRPGITQNSAPTVNVQPPFSEESNFRAEQQACTKTQWNGSEQVWLYSLTCSQCFGVSTAQQKRRNCSLQPQRRRTARGWTAAC